MPRPRRRKRFALIASTLVVAGAAFVVLRPDPEAPASLDEGAVSAAPAPEAEPAGGSGPPRTRGDELFRQGQSEAAFQLYEEAVAGGEADALVLTRLTLMALLDGNWTKAELYGGRIAELAPGAPEAAAAEAALRFAGTSGDERAAAAQAALDLIAANPELVLARWPVIEWLRAEERFCETLPHLDAVIAEAPALYKLHELKLNAHSRTEDWSAVAGQLEAMHRLFPDNAEVGQWLLDSYRGQGNAEGVIRLLRERAAAAGGDPAPRLELVAAVRDSQGDAAAAAELARLVEDSAGTPVASALRLELGLELLRQDRAEEAEAPLQAVVEAPESSQLTVNDARAALARALYAQGDADRAEALAQEILAQDSGHVPTLKAQAEWLIADERPEEALRKLQFASAQNGSDIEILTLQAQAHEMRGDLALAGDLLVRAVEVSEEGAAERERLAEFLRRQGKDAIADAVLGKAGAPPRWTPPEPEPAAAQPACPAP
ncbi:tetratricopeptide repeat protein [Rubellimicrobium roseum]|uniref:Uncharacterized protein n=1 Tax=Rubellimicrobium roseum TaxID=687525 RepID=A0A5C4NBY8_9RHOB|nr:hypothetical protein [Rubellimicrobium roseum]TNC71395.1 hypothetical protein FHG71_11615 [Rubellimicrobium roseum]